MSAGQWGGQKGRVALGWHTLRNGSACETVCQAAMHCVCVLCVSNVSPGSPHQPMRGRARRFGPERRSSRRGGGGIGGVRGRRVAKGPK